MIEQKYKKFRIYKKKYIEFSSVMNIKKCGNDFTVKYPDVITSEEIDFYGNTVLYQRFNNIHRSNDIFIVGGIKINDEYILDRNKKYMMVLPIKSKKKKKDISKLLIFNNEKVDFL